MNDRRTEGRSEHTLQVCMRETSIMLVHDDPEPMLSKAEAGMIRIRLLEQARLRKEADAYWAGKLMQAG